MFDASTASRRLTPGRPLVVVDADEVILRFVDGFDRFLRDRDLFLDLTSYRLHGNVKRIIDKTTVLDVEVTALLDEFRQDLDSLEPVDGASDALTRVAGRADVVVLSNVTAAQGAARLRNLKACGLDFPVVCNAGPKGPAVRDLSMRAGRPVFFIDDIAPHLASVAESAPHVLRIHLVGDARLKSLLPISEHAHLRAASWQEAAEFMLSRLDEAA
jgi:hypothetical protein